MTSAANHEAYGDPRWTHGRSGGRGPWGRNHGGGGGGGGGWVGQGWEHYWMPPALIGIPKPVLIILMVLGFILWWPIGLVLLALMLWRRHVTCGGYRQGAWQQGGAGYGTGWKSWCGSGSGRAQPSSGNRAFDEYRTETLHRLEEEQKEFGEFLDRLRFAKDKVEFDQFMNELRNRPPEAPPEPPRGEPGA
ncbi:MAG: DUF2852 domain-containing protein [Stellaceae bacterium]